MFSDKINSKFFMTANRELAKAATHHDWRRQNPIKAMGINKETMGRQVLYYVFILLLFSY
jgi:hypothetical protein